MQARPVPVWAAVVLCLVAAGAAAQETRQLTVLQIHILEGEGAVHGTGSRTSRALIVQIADETGRPVEGAAVNFRLPDEEPTGTFASGLRTDVQVAGADGKVSLPLVQWGTTPGPIRIRVTAAKDQARAGAFVSHYVTDLAGAPAVGGSGGGADDDGGGVRIGRGKLLTAALLAAGAVAGGLVLSRGGASSAPAPGLIGGSTQQPTQVGPPLIRITRP